MGTPFRRTKKHTLKHRLRTLHWWLQNEPNKVVEQLQNLPNVVGVDVKTWEDYPIFYTNLEYKPFTVFSQPQLGLPSTLTMWEFVGVRTHPLTPNVFVVRDMEDPTLVHIVGYEKPQVPHIVTVVDEDVKTLLETSGDIDVDPEVLVKVFYIVPFCTHNTPLWIEAKRVTEHIAKNPTMDETLRVCAVKCLQKAAGRV